MQHTHGHIHHHQRTVAEADHVLVPSAPKSPLSRGTLDHVRLMPPVQDNVLMRGYCRVDLANGQEKGRRKAGGGWETREPMVLVPEF
jgi:hypothetical protein